MGSEKGSSCCLHSIIILMSKDFRRQKGVNLMQAFSPFFLSRKNINFTFNEIITYSLNSLLPFYKRGQLSLSLLFPSICESFEIFHLSLSSLYISLLSGVQEYNGLPAYGEKVKFNKQTSSTRYVTIARSKFKLSKYE